MAAGLGFKTFTTGEVLTAADVNGYLMQGVLVFASEAARDAAITSPQEGQFAFTKDNNSLWYYSGAAWVASGATGDIEGVTAGTGISGGGTSGTVTITNSMATEIDAKGDLVVGTGADTFARLAVGTNDYVLTAASGETTGLKWAAPASGTTFAGCSLYRTVDQTGIATATNTAILWDAEHFDTDGYHSTVTNTSRITIPSGKAGKYLICGMTEIALLSATKVQTIIYLNGSIVQYAGDYQGTGTNVKGPYSIVLDLAVNDYIEIFARQDSGSNADTNSGTQRINVSVSLLGA
jgi:hypothetical protein